MKNEGSHILAQSLTLTDAKGRPRLTLGLDNHGEPFVRLLTRQGAEGAVLSLRANHDGNAISASLHLGCEDSGAAASLTADAAGHAIVELSSGPNENTAFFVAEVEVVDGRPEAGMYVRDEHASMGWSAAGGEVEYRGGRLP